MTLSSRLWRIQMWWEWLTVCGIREWPWHEKTLGRVWEPVSKLISISCKIYFAQFKELDLSRKENALHCPMVLWLCGVLSFGYIFVSLITNSKTDTSSKFWKKHYSKKKYIKNYNLILPKVSQMSIHYKCNGQTNLLIKFPVIIVDPAPRWIWFF